MEREFNVQPVYAKTLNEFNQTFDSYFIDVITVNFMFTFSLTEVLSQNKK